MDPAERNREDNKSSEMIAISDPWVSRHRTSALIIQSSGPAGSDIIHAADKGVYGDGKRPIKFRIGNGGAGYTGILRMLCEKFISLNGNDFRIGWVSNHSRHSQIALLAGIVQVALTYEPENEEISIEEGWATRPCRAFNDHFVLVGPNVEIDNSSIAAALRDIAGRRDRSGIGRRPLLFHTRGDGSATFSRERMLWKAAGVQAEGEEWVETYPLTPYDALVKAQEAEAFLLTDRATFLTAKEDQRIPSLRVHVEGGEQLLNPCSALVAAKEVGKDEIPDESRALATSFATWLASSTAQDLIRDYGKDWISGKPLFTVAGQEDFEQHDRLSHVRDG